MNNFILHETILRLDGVIQAQLNQIIFHPNFMALEASWLGINMLTKNIHQTNRKTVKIKVLNISWDELTRDLQRAADIEQSNLFVKIYNLEFDLPGGEPFGLLIGDYKVSHQKKSRASLNDLQILSMLAKIAAAAFSPFVTAASAELFGLDSFSDLGKSLNFSEIFQQQEYSSWRYLRQHPDSRFVGLILPDILLKAHYHLWGNAAYLFALNIIHTYLHSGWFAEICSVSHQTITLVKEKHLLNEIYDAYKFSTHVLISEKQEKLLSEEGFISLYGNAYSQKNIIYSCPSLQIPKMLEKNIATENAKLSSMLNYILCVSRFAHYVKVMIREKIGTFSSPQDCENYLQNWLRQYTAVSPDMSQELRAKYPLREAKVHVWPKVGQAGAYWCTLHLAPHYQFDNADAYLQLTTELVQRL